MDLRVGGGVQLLHKHRFSDVVVAVVVVVVVVAVFLSNVYSKH